MEGALTHGKGGTDMSTGPRGSSAVHLLATLALLLEPMRLDGFGDRELLQMPSLEPTANPEITLEYAFMRRIPEPVDWNVYEVEIRNAFQLRSAICESQGDVYLQDPKTGDEVDSCFYVGAPKRKTVVLLRDDIYLRGEKLPPITHYFKMEGRCDQNPDQICSIHAVSGMCSSCPLPNENTESNDLKLCEACQFGGLEGRDTRPVLITPGGKLWLQNIELAGCKTQASGGCIMMESGNRNVWRDNTALADLTYLEARNCRFKRGYARGEGGVLLIQSGALAFFEESSFILNFAGAKSQTTAGQTADKSHDIMIQNFAAVILADCTPNKLHVTSTQLLPNSEVFTQPYQQGKVFVTNVELLTPPSPKGLVDQLQAPPPPLDPTVADDDDNNSPGSAIEPDGQGESLPTWLLALVVVLSVSVTALVVACCWWCCWPAKEDVEEGVDIGLKSTKSMFDTVYKTRGMGAKSMMKVRTRASNFSTRFRSAFKSFMKNGDGNSVVDITERYTIPGTDGKTYTAEELMKGRLNNWTGDPDRDAGALPQSQRSRWALPFRG